MKEEVRVIKLYREILQEEEVQQRSCKNMDGKYFFAMDYFDTLLVEKKEMTDAFGTIVNLGNVEKTDGKQIAVQSYSLYYSHPMWEKFEKGELCGRKNPFDQTRDLGYLSIVQVHITPEILRRVDYACDDIWECGESIILEPFIMDLYQILDDYWDANPEENLVYRVYHVLSTGDLAVVIKSRYPETSFNISSQIRKRVAGLRVKGKIEKTDWTIYKTYTLLTIDGSVAQNSICRTNRGRFVIRGCYSCLYWAKASKERAAGMAKTSGLTGRYDFSVELPEDQFLRYLYPEIALCKGGMKVVQDIDTTDDTEHMSDEVLYLRELLRKGHLSYINERYLMPEPAEDPGEQKSCGEISEYILLRENACNEKTLRQSNACYIMMLLERYRKLKEQLIDIKGVHKNLEQYLILLKKQIVSCNTINELSDTRVYTYGLGRQIEIVLGSLEYYCTMYEKSKLSMDIKGQASQVEILELLVEYLRESVYAMDSYAQYVRNNNLQSLQTPNYNIESNMGVEKILIGYSEYLRKFIIYYQKAVVQNRLHELIKDITPVVIPDLHGTDMCVEALFPEGNGYHWKDESEVRQGKSGQYLLVIDSPTLAELGDIPVFMAMLFHELAHQFRYESREKRNKLLVSLAVDEVAAAIAQKVSGKLERHIAAYDIYEELEKILRGALKEPISQWITKRYEEEMEKEAGSSPFDVPLNYFERGLSEKFEELFAAWNNSKEWRERYSLYVNEIQQNCNWYREDMIWYVELLDELLDAEKMNGETDGRRNVIRIEKAVCVLTWRTAYEKMTPEERQKELNGAFILHRDKLKDWFESDEQVRFSELWKDFEGTEDYAEITYIQELGEELLIWVYGHGLKKEEGMQQIFDSVYEDLHKMWEQKYRELSINDKDEPRGLYRSWILAGRHLGIDYPLEDNRKKFQKVMLEVPMNELDMGEVPNKFEIYRETTSDIFMCCMMKLSAFGYLNLTALIIPEGRLNYGANLQRITYVIHVLERNSLESIRHTHMEICKSLWGQVEQYYYCHLKKGTYRDIEEQFCWIKTTDYKDSSGILAVIEETSGHCGRESREKYVLKHIARMVELLQAFKDDGIYYMAELQDDEELWQDLEYGAEFLEDIRKDMEQSPDAFIKELVNICDQNAEYLNTQHYKTGVMDNIELNRTSIEFVLKLYYSRKIASARTNYEEGGYVDED